jgi:hypothetical protein
MLDDVEDGDDVWVVDAAGSQRLAPEPRQHLVAGRQCRQDPFQRDTTFGADVDRRIDLRHAAAAQETFDPVLVRDDFPNRQRLRPHAFGRAVPLSRLQPHDSIRSGGCQQALKGWVKARVS